jgi:8-oxo-dGTP pyrophosphatase MutT (NUDIX family)
MFENKPKVIELMNEISTKPIVCPVFELTDEIKEYVRNFNSDEDFLRKGGLSTEMLDRLAFGFANIDIATLNPNQLSIKWKEDLENVKYEIQKSGLTPKVWASKVNLTEPIDVSYEKNKFFIEDGHHRFVAAKVLNKPLNVNLEIKDNPIIKIAPKLGYDDVMRCIFKQVKDNNLKESNLLPASTTTNLLNKLGITDAKVSKQELVDLQKEIENNYHKPGENMFNNYNDIRQNLFNYDEPLFETNINGVNVRYCHGLIRDKRNTYLLYADGKIIGEFKNKDDVEKLIKFIKDVYKKKQVNENRIKTSDNLLTELKRYNSEYIKNIFETYFILHKGDIYFFDYSQDNFITNFLLFVEKNNLPKVDADFYEICDYIENKFITNREYIAGNFLKLNKDIVLNIFMNEFNDVKYSDEIKKILNDFPAIKNIRIDNVNHTRDEILNFKFNTDFKLGEYVYHGTSLMNLKGILKTGLRPKSGDSYFKDMSDKLIHITTSLNVAKNYAIINTTKDFNSKNQPIIIEIKTDKINKNLIDYDYKLSLKDNNLNINKTSNLNKFGYKGYILPTQINRIGVGGIVDNMKTIKWYTMNNIPDEFVNESTLDYFNNKIYYHGGDSIINKFTKTKPKNRISNIEGFYFTDNINIAKKYGPEVTSVYLNIKNPFYINKTEPNTELIKTYKTILELENPNVDNEWINNKVDFLIKNKIIYPTGMSGENLKKCFISGGYDSVIDGYEVCVFNENDIVYIDKETLTESDSQSNINCYHTSLSDFNNFDSSKIGSMRNLDNMGFFFTKKEEDAKDFGDLIGRKKQQDFYYLYNCSVNINNPYTFKQFQEDFNGEYKTGYDGNLTSTFDLNKEFILDKIKENNHDGLIFGNLVMCLRPNQIKIINKTKIERVIGSMEKFRRQQSLTEANSQLEDTFIKINSPNIKSHIDSLINKYGDKAEVMNYIKHGDEESKKPEYSISYTYCKKLISLADNLKDKHSADKDKFELYGGFPLINYLSKELTNKRDTISRSKKTKTMIGFNNQYRKTHQKTGLVKDAKRYVDGNLREHIELIKESETKVNKEASCIVLLNEDKKILLLKRSQTTNWEPGKWSLVGGKIDLGEDAQQAAIRECGEETGLGIKGNKLIYCFTMKEDDYEVNFFIGVSEGSDVRLNSEHTEYKWVTPNEITELETVPNLLGEIKKCFETLETNSQEVVNETLLTEKLANVDEDVDFLYNTYFKDSIDEIQRTGIITKEMFKSDLKYILELPLHNIKSITGDNNYTGIYINRYDGYWFDPIKNSISLSLINGDKIYQCLRKFNGGIKEFCSTLTPNSCKYFMDNLTEVGVKASIHHELAHYIDNYKNNYHIYDKGMRNKLTAGIPFNNDYSINASKMEIEGQIHEIKQLYKKYKNVWDELSLNDLFNKEASLISVFRALKPEIRKQWLKDLVLRMNREGLLGKNMRINNNINEEIKDVHDNGAYRITINNQVNPNHITLFYENKKVGVLDCRIDSKSFEFCDDKKYNYYYINHVEIDEKHQGLGYGKRMYKLLETHRSDDVKGIISYTPDRVNYKQILSIYRRYANIEEGDYHVIIFDKTILESEYKIYYKLDKKTMWLTLNDFNDETKYKLNINDYNLIDVYSDKFSKLLDEFTGEEDSLNFEYYEEPTKELEDFYISKGYDGFKNADDDIYIFNKKMKNNNINENASNIDNKSKDQLNRIFNKLNKEYVKLDKLLDNTKDSIESEKISEKLEEIQALMSKVSAKMESNINESVINEDANKAQYLKWKRNNVTYRGIKNFGQENNVYGSFGKGLYTVPASNKSMAKTYGSLYFVVNAIPKRPKVVNSLNDAEIFRQTLIDNYCKQHNNGKYDRGFFDNNTSMDIELLKLGYDGLVIKGREIVNYKPENGKIKYFQTENQLIQYYEDFIQNNNDSINETLLTEKLANVDEDVNMLYDLYFKDDIDEIQRTGIITKEMFQKTETNTSILKTEESVKAHEMNPCKIKVNLRPNAYNPVEKWISISVNPNALNFVLSDFNGDIQKGNEYLKGDDNHNRLPIEFTEHRIKGGIHHELAHWIDDTLNNEHLNKMIVKRNERTKPVKNPVPINATTIEIQGIIHNIKQFYNLHKDTYDNLTLSDLFKNIPSLNVVLKQLKSPFLEKWLKDLVVRMNREGLLGKNMRLTKPNNLV